MNLYQVALIKSYLVTINAKSKEQAKGFAEFYTSDIQDISSENEKLQNQFLIKEIECTVNEAFECEKIIPIS